MLKITNLLARFVCWGKSDAVMRHQRVNHAEVDAHVSQAFAASWGMCNYSVYTLQSSGYA